MHLKNEKETSEAIETWRSSSPAIQLRNLHKAREVMELDQMHYEQKDHTRGIERCVLCLTLLQQRIDELDLP